MAVIRILHRCEPDYGWSFESPDIPGLAGGANTYDAANAEEAARFALVCDTEERGMAAPPDVTFEHYVPAGVAVAA
jgi:predicted RNase H-like HicB family nuclease